MCATRDATDAAPCAGSRRGPGRPPVYQLPQRLLRVVGLLARSAGPFPLAVCCRSFADAWRGETIPLDARRYKVRELVKWFARAQLFQVATVRLHPKNLDLDRVLALPAFSALRHVHISDAALTSFPGDRIPLLRELHLIWCLDLAHLALSAKL